MVGGGIERPEGRSNFKSIASDFLSLANGKTLANLDNGYTGMAYDNYLIDLYDTITNQYTSLINPKYDLKQTKTIEIARQKKWSL